MGGYGSGRRSGRPTTDDGLTLDLLCLLEQRRLVPGLALAGSLTWTNTRTEAYVGSLGYESDLGAERGCMRLSYTTSRGNGDKHDLDYSIELETTPQPFGGRRWWFLCPRTGERVAKLHLPPSALTFASRKAYRLAYRSQRETACDRARSRAFKLRARLGAGGGIGDVVPRPKGMHLSTYDRHLDRIWRVEDVVEAHGQALLAKLQRIGRKAAGRCR